MNFLHTYHPQSVLFFLGSVAIHWYGLFMMFALSAGLLVSLRVAKKRGIERDVIYDMFFWLTIGGLVGARIFYVLYNFEYFWRQPLAIFKIWQGGIAIHGALLVGLAVLWYMVRKQDTLMFWLLASVVAPGVALGQAIGRWGNYFNQELFGLPTTLPWGIPIDLVNRPSGFTDFIFFHPVFLYESLGDLIIFMILIWMHARAKSARFVVLTYVFLYSTLRLAMEFLRIDPTAGNFFGLRATQALSLFFILGSLVYWRR